MNRFISVGVAILIAGCSSKQVVVCGKQPVVTVTAEMQKEARYAYYEEERDTAALKKVLERGFPINHVVNEYGETLLHIVAEAGNTLFVRFLLANGADVMAVDQMLRRPIDVAYAKKHWGVCRLLARKKPACDAMLEGVPVGVWEVVFRDLFRIGNPSGDRFLVLSVNGQPVSDAVAEWISRQGVNVGTNGYFEDLYQETGRKVWRDEKTREVATLCWFFFEKHSSNHYCVIRGNESGPSKGRGFAEYEARKKYGYWLGEWISSGSVFSPQGQVALRDNACWESPIL